MRRIGSLLALCALLCASPAWAHRLNVFAWAEAGAVVAEARFSDGKTARDATVEARDGKDGPILVSGRTDADGRCRLTLPAERQGEAVILTVDAGSGHRGSWTVTGAELQAASSATASPGSTASADPAHLLALERRVAELEGVRMRDVVGGLGWFVGLAGLAWGWSGRRRGKDQS